MRIVSTIFFTATFLGATISAGWCPEPANLGGYLSSTSGATGAAIYVRPSNGPMEDGQDKRDYKNMTRSERMTFLGREKAAGHITNAQEMRNFLQTGDPHLSWTPPPPKPPPSKPASMSNERWSQIQAQHPNVFKPAAPPTSVRGTYVGSGSGRTMEQNATANGGKLTPYTAPKPTPTPTMTATSVPAKRP